MGTAPGFGAPEGPMPEQSALEASTFAAFADMDASPTKTWLITEALQNPEHRHHFDAAFGLRPGEELYDLRKDPDQVHNVAAAVEYGAARSELSARLMQVLTSTGDPRVAERDCVFDGPPFTDDAEKPAPRRNKK